jgi:hypothetical protein
MKLRRRATIAGGVALLALAATIGPASAKPLERVHFHDSSSAVIPEFCPGLTVRIHVEIDRTSLLNPHGPDGLAYGSEHFHGTESLTNLANDKTITRIFNFIMKDLKVTDNGDGTLTILMLATGGERWYGPDGQFLFNNPGQMRLEFLIDDGGTPTDPTDDQFLAFLGLVKGSTGRNDIDSENPCDQILPVIG